MRYSIPGKDVQALLCVSLISAQFSQSAQPSELKQGFRDLLDYSKRGWCYLLLWCCSSAYRKRSCTPDLSTQHDVDVNY